MVGLSRIWLSLGLVVSSMAALLVGVASPAGAVAGYGDVGEGTWYTDAVQWSVDNNIADIAGSCFGPDTPVSRGETAVWIYNMENQPDAGDPHSFSDVTDASQDDAVSWMANNEITTGKSPTTFAPDDTLTRAEAATFLHRLAGKPSAPPHSFVDVVKGWQQDGVSWMADTGITTGKSPTTFAPEDTLTRAHLVTFLYRYQDEPDVTLNTSTPDCDPTTDMTATVTATPGMEAGFTLSGAVSDGRIDGLAVLGATVRLEDGTRESVTTDADGQFQFLNILGQVEVRVTAPGYLEQSVRVTVDSEDRALNFVLEHTGESPYGGTVWVTPDILGPCDPTLLGNVAYSGRGLREVFDRRVESWVTVNVYVFEAQLGERTVEFQVNSEFGSEKAAREQVDTFAPAIGRLPAVIVSELRKVEVNAGEGLFGGNRFNGSFLIHTDDENTKRAVREGFLEEVFLHEGAHVSLDPLISDAPGWRWAQRADGAFISGYARDHPDREDVAESFLPYFAVRHRPDRLTPEELWFMMTTIPNRLAYFDEQHFNMSAEPPLSCPAVADDQARSTIRGTLVGPDGQPLAGVGIWAWQSDVDNSGFADTRDDGTFAISVPDGLFTLDIYAAADGSCAGWYDGESVTDNYSEAAKLDVEGQDIDGITIRLAALPADTPSGQC